MSAYVSWFNHLYDSQAEKMVMAARRTMGNATMAEDMMHAAFLTLLSKGPEMMDHPNPEGFLYVTLGNHMKNEMRRANRRREVPLEMMTVEPGRPDEYFSFEDRLPEGLTEDERTILRMYFSEEESYEYIAQYFGKSVAACRTKLCRAKNRYAELLEKEKLKEKEKFSDKTCHIPPGNTNIKDRRCRDAGDSS